MEKERRKVYCWVRVNIYAYWNLWADFNLILSEDDDDDTARDSLFLFFEALEFNFDREKNVFTYDVYTFFPSHLYNGDNS